MSADGASPQATALLTVDLAAVRENWRRLRARAPESEVAPVLKADGYGLGAVALGKTLAEVGAESFFVARLEEGLTLRAALPGPRLFVLDGLGAGEESTFLAHRLIPVLNSLAEIDRWRRAARERERNLPAALHLDSGMNRLGLAMREAETLAREPERLNGLDLVLVASHLACSDQAQHPMNERQRAYFDRARGHLPPAPASLAASGGIFLGPRFHYALVRPGYALLGGNPSPGQANPMLPVIELKARILQVRQIDAPASVGYGASHLVPREAWIATVGLGYADGMLRSLSNRGLAWVHDRAVPFAGRVSMDLTTLDISALPPDQAKPGEWVELLGAHQDLDTLARQAGTIGYEILTALGTRYQRRYLHR